FVLAVSAFDFCVHEVVRTQMLEVHKGTRQPTSSFRRFRISMESLQAALASPNDHEWLDNEIRIQHSWKSFQHPDNVADAVRLVSDASFWDRVAASIGQDPLSTKRQLGLIVDRRNKIAHEADMDPTTPGDRWPIDSALVQESVEFLKLIVGAMQT